MSRTVHHVPFAHWNQRERDLLPGRDYLDWPVGHVLHDLRFFAGCRRTPEKVHRTVPFGGYGHGHDGTRAVTIRAREIEGGIRDARRAY